MAEKSERTRRLEEAKIEDDPLYFKRAIRGATLGMSRAADKMGIGKDKKEEPVKKAKGGLLAPSKKVLAKSGFYDKDKTKSEREKIVGKVTTKPQRVKMVEKMLSTKKMKSGGSVSKRADGVAIKGKTKGRFV
jgi:hypothetical protein